MLVSGIGYFDSRANSLKNIEAYNNNKSQSKSALGEVFGNYNDSFSNVANNNDLLTRIFKSVISTFNTKSDNSKHCLDLIS